MKRICIFLLVFVSLLTDVTEINAQTEWQEYQIVDNYFKDYEVIREKGLERINKIPFLWNRWFMELMNCIEKTEGIIPLFPEQIGYYSFEEIELASWKEVYTLNGLVIRKKNIILPYPIMLIRKSEIFNPVIVKHEYLHILCPYCDHNSYRFKKCTGKLN